MNNQYKYIAINQIINHSDTLRSFVLDYSFNATPGQFIMIWVPGMDEKPFSLSAPNRITVKKVGPFTEHLFSITGGHLHIRGPFGQGFPLEKGGVAVGGGCGIAPLVSLISGKESFVDSFVMAGKSECDMIFHKELCDTLGESNVKCVTEDGTKGCQGMATDIDLPLTNHNYYLCGPEIMMHFVVKKLLTMGINPSKIYLSLERYMKCAIGLCGNCSISGYRVCADGPVFPYTTISSLPHFNKSERTRTGELIYYD